MAEVECVAPTSCVLGRSPVWSPSEGFLWWLDTKRAKLHRYNPRTRNTRRYDLPLRASALALASGRLLLAGERALGLYDPATEDYRPLLDLPEEPDCLHLNTICEGIVGPQNAFWFLTCDEAEEGVSGALYTLAGSETPMQPQAWAGVASLTPSGVAFSPDGKTLYISDKANQEILSFEYDAGCQRLGERRVFATTLSAGCYPEGLAVDMEGYVWNAQWAGSRLVRYAPDGVVDRIVPLPVSRPTACAFGGEDLKTLFVTSARLGLSPAALDRQPLAGCLFSLEVEVAGMPVAEWVG